MVRAGLILIWTFLKAYDILSPFALQPQYYYVFRHYVLRYRQKYVFYVTLTVLITLPLTPTVKIFKEAKVIMCHFPAAFGFKSLVNKHVILKYPPVLSLAALKFYYIPAITYQPMLSLKYDYFCYKWSLLQSHSCLAICVMTSVFYMGNTDSKEVFITL